MQEYLDPSGCPAQRPTLENMAEVTRSLHKAVDQAIKKTGIPYLHPEDPSVQLDLLGSRHMIEWQEGKAEAIFAGERCWSELPQVYGRYGVESTRELITVIRDLERASGVVLTDCGMQACALLFDVLVQPNSHALIMRQVYNKTKKHLEWLCSRLGAKVTLLDDHTVMSTDGAAIERAIEPETVLVFAETFTNPLTRALDPDRLGALAQQARKTKAPRLRLIIDNTIASPWALKKPLLSYEGVDVVVASGTKSLAGQDRDMWGYIASRRIDLLNEIMDLQATRGGSLDWRRARIILQEIPNAERAFRGRCETAARVADFLDLHPKVEEVFHPGLPDHPDAKTIAKHYQLTGSLLSFRVAGLNEDESRHFADVLTTCVVPRYALSFDGLTTKLNHHPTVSEYFTPAEELERCGFDRILRLGVGVEDADDIIACLNWALWHHDLIDATEVLQWQKSREAELGIYGASPADCRGISGRD